jgi:hypothetical protein
MEELLKSVEDTIEKYIGIISQKYNIPKENYYICGKGMRNVKFQKNP